MLYSHSLKKILEILVKSEEYDKPDYDEILLEISSLTEEEKKLDFIQVILDSSEENCIPTLERAEYLMEENRYVFSLLDSILDTEFLEYDTEFLDDEE